MNAGSILNDDMSLEDKLAAIEKAMADFQDKAKEEAKRLGQAFVPLDPSELTACDGCQ